MSFYRKITRERTLCSFNDFQTNDKGLKESISRFSRKPREAKFYGTLKIQEDYYSKKGVNDKYKRENPLSDIDDSDSDNRSYSWRMKDLRDWDDEKFGLKEKSYTKIWKEKTPLKWFRKRTKSNDSFFSEAKSSYGTDMSFSDTRSVYDKERFGRMEDDRDFVSERSRDRDPISILHEKSKMI